MPAQLNCVFGHPRFNFFSTAGKARALSSALVFRRCASFLLSLLPSLACCVLSFVLAFFAHYAAACLSFLRPPRFCFPSFSLPTAPHAAQAPTLPLSPTQPLFPLQSFKPMPAGRPVAGRWHIWNFVTHLSVRRFPRHRVCCNCPPACPHQVLDSIGLVATFFCSP